MVTEKELEESLNYLEAFAKGQETKPINGGKKETDEEPDDELYQAHKKKLASYLDKAMMHKGCMEKIRKGEPLPDEAFEDLDEEEPAAAPAKKEEKQNGGEEETVSKAKVDELVKAQVSAALEEQKKQSDELVKAQITEALNAQKAESDKIIKGLQDEIQTLKDTPVRKTVLKGADAITLKKALAGEEVEGKKLLSVSLQKSQVSNALFEAYESEKDEMTKGMLGEAVAEFESTGGFVSPEVAKYMENKGIQLIK